ncbi:MAG: hypothetical protein HN368_19040, partial [Spirochaetales bacterium]|nr:hypothetical protein [Spirochaetales bacterium]
MQTSHEIIDGLLRNKPVERLGLNDYPWDDTLVKWAEEVGYPKTDDGEPLSPVDYFDFDLAGCGGWFDLFPKQGYSEVLEETDEWIVKRNGAGAALKNWKHKSGTPEHIDFTMTSREIWDRDYRSHLLTVDKRRLDIEKTKKELTRRKTENRWT